MQRNTKPTLIVVTGPTASGKTGLAIELAEHFDTEIVSADSRQIYRGIPIGTASPTPEQLARVRHHFIATLGLDEYYSAALYEEQALETLNDIWDSGRDYAVMCGGSMMYIDAVTRGIDPLPTISDRVREKALEIYNTGGLEALHKTLQEIDPETLRSCDPQNHRRLIHAIEITLEAGVPCSSLRTGTVKERPFNVVKLAIGHSREALFDRINRRVDVMMEQGLEQEARSVYPLRHLNSLNTVGFKEMFAYFDGLMDYDTAVARIAKNTRVYAKKQMLWLSKDPSAIMLDPSDAFREAIAAIGENGTIE